VFSFPSHKARTEHIRLVVPGKDNAVTFSEQKRGIGTNFDEMMVLGIDDLAGVDALYQHWRTKSIVSILKAIMPGLMNLSPQRVVHAKTIYSVFNVLRRCPPGPIFATLVANPDFENVNGDYWHIATS
jgi:hypothetical protein